MHISPLSILNKITLNEKIKASVTIFDEIHNFRNGDTLGYKNAKSISLCADYRVG